MIIITYFTVHLLQRCNEDHHFIVLLGLRIILSLTIEMFYPYD